MSEFGKDHPFSPHYKDKDGVFIDGTEYPSVACYMKDHPAASLDDVYLCKFTQHIHYQKHVDLLIKCHPSWQYTEEWEIGLKRSMVYVHEELKNRTDVEWIELFGYWTKTANRECISDRIQYINACQPFMGRSKALFLSLIWVNKRLYSCLYDRRVEKTLESFNIMST